MAKAIKKFLAAVDQIFFGVSICALVIVAVLCVFFRFILRNPIVWGEEVEMILVVWSVFFGGSIAVREKGHIAVDILYDMFPSAAKKVMDVLIWILVTIAIAFIMKLEIDRVMELFKTKLRTPVLQLPSYIEYAGVSLGCGLMLLNHLINGVERVFVRNKEEAADNE